MYDLESISASEALLLLEKEPSSHLVDVRTTQEWQMLGVPDLSGMNKDVMFISWKLDGQINENFIEELEVAIPNKDDVVIFICSAGVRSSSAASFAHEHGYKNVINISDGFDGKGGAGGWKNSNSDYTVLND